MLIWLIQFFDAESLIFAVLNLTFRLGSLDFLSLIIILVQKINCNHGPVRQKQVVKDDNNNTTRYKNIENVML